MDPTEKELADAAYEKKKYDFMYKRLAYRTASPGLNAANEVFHYFEMQEGQTLTDYGCGLGRAGQFFAKKGLRVTLTDISDEGVAAEGVALLLRKTEEGWLLPFVQCCLWLPKAQELPSADFSFCADVMEHIPEEYADRVIQLIYNRTRFGAFFSVSTCPDGCGKGTPYKLHMNVKPIEYWEQMFSKWFHIEHREGVKFFLRLKGKP